MSATGREARVSAALGTPVETSAVRGSVGRGPLRLRRHLVLAAALHLRAHLPPTDCTRQVLARLTRDIERVVARSPASRGVNAKFIQRDPVCDAIYRRLRALPRRAPWPRGEDGMAMTRGEVESAVAIDRWWSAAMDARRDAYRAESDADLERLRDLLVRPMPLEERIRRYAPPIEPPPAVAPGPDLHRATDGDLALLYRDGRLRRRATRTALDAAVVERARRLSAIHRRRLGLD